MIFMPLPAVAGAIGALNWIMAFLAGIAPFFPKVFTAASAILKFCFSWKGVLTAVAAWFGLGLIGLEEQRNELAVWLIEEVGKVLYSFLFDEESGIVWLVCYGIIWLGEGVITGFEGLGLLDQSFGEHGAAISWASEWIGRMNQFFPITEAGALIVVFLTFMFFFIMVKAIAKMIPGIG